MLKSRTPFCYAPAGVSEYAFRRSSNSMKQNSPADLLPTIRSAAKLPTIGYSKAMSVAGPISGVYMPKNADSCWWDLKNGWMSCCSDNSTLDSRRVYLLFRHDILSDRR